MSSRIRSAALALVVATALTVVSPTPASAAHEQWTYTLDADFDQGTLNNVVHNIPDQLQLDDTTTPFPFIWIPLTERGTIVKIDTATGEIKGTYHATSEGDPAPSTSRTTVANDGSVWAGNRTEGTVIHIGNLEAGGCVDRNGNGTIETSTGADVLSWPGGSPGNSAPVAAAADECILHLVPSRGGDSRHVSVDADGNVWVGDMRATQPGAAINVFRRINGATGAVMREVRLPCGGYGGLLDSRGILWSVDFDKAQLLRWDPTTDPSTAQCLDAPGAYGAAADSHDNIWVSTWGPGSVHRFGPGGTHLAQYPMGHPSAQGIVVDDNDHVWITSARTHGSNRISHLDNNGTLLGLVTGAGEGSSGISVDAAGKIWTSNWDSSDATRIDPTKGAAGEFDLTVPLPAGSHPYNYSDMTGSTLIGAPNAGTWSVVHDSGIAGAQWGVIDWTADVPATGGLTFTVASSADGITWSDEVPVTDGSDMTVPDGRYLRISAAFTRAAGSPSPILYDVTIAVANHAPVCDPATAGPSSIWPPNHTMVPVTVQGVTDADGDAVTIEITSIRQDEPVEARGDGAFAPDGTGVGTDTANVRAERSGGGDGRFYHIGFTATDGFGGSCTGTVRTVVPHDMSKTPVDQGPLHDSTAPGQPGKPGKK